MKQKKAAAPAPPLSTSINSDTDALAMSYNDSPTQEGLTLPAPSSSGNDNKELTEEEAQKARKRSSFNSFISPAERKRRQQEKLGALDKKKEQEDSSPKIVGGAATAAAAAAAVEDEKSEISMTDSEKQRVEVVQRTSFISPMERKKRALERQKSLQAEKEGSENNEQGDVVTKSSSVSSSIAKFNETFGKKDTKQSFNEILTKKADAVLKKGSPTAEDNQAADKASILSVDVPPTLSDIEAAVTAPAAQDPERTVFAESFASSTSSSLVSASYPTPKESDREKAKRAAIQAVMKDASLSPVEKNEKIQSIIRGNFEVPDGTAAATAARGPPKEEGGEESSSGEEEEGDSSSGEYETTSEEEEEEEEGDSSSGEYETTSEEEEEEEESGEYESSSGEEESTTVVVEPAVSPVEAAPKDTSSSVAAEEETSEIVESLKAEAALEETAVDESTAVSNAAAIAKEKSDIESKLDEELENHQALERQHEQRKAEFRAEQDRLRKAEAAEAERLRLLEMQRREEQRRLEEEQRLLEEERLRMELEQQAAENERRRRLEEEGQRALELVQRRLQEDKEKQKVLRAQQEEQRQYEEQRRQLEEEQRRLEADREHQQILNRQREQMLQLQEEQRRLEEQRNQFEEEQRRLRKERVREPVQVSRAVGNVEITATRNTRPTPRSSPNKTISSSLPGGQRSGIPPPTRVAPITSTSQQNTRYDGVDDDELNWRLDSYAMLSDYTIIVRRALPGPHAPDFEIDDANAIDFSMDSGTPKFDSYYVHKAMIAVGSRRSELLGRRIREADSTSRPDGHSSDVNVHETIMLESAADAMGIVLDFCYYPDKPLEINIYNAVPLVYLGKRYKIRALIDQSEEFVHTHLESTNAIHFLLDSYLYQLDDILSRAIDVTAANLGATLDFNPIYKLPPELFRRIILSKDLNCDSELLSLIVYSYCGEHHAEDIDVEYLRELTKQRLMPEIDSKVALMLLKFYVDLIFADDENCDIMDVLVGDSLMQRCIAVAAKHWQGEVYEPLMVDSEFNEKRPPAQEPTAIHRALPTKLQNHLLEKCIIEAKNDFDSERVKKEAQQSEKQAEIEAVTKSCDAIVRDLQNKLRESEKNEDKKSLEKHLDKLEATMLEMEAELELQKKKAEAYKQELQRFRRVPGIHNFGEVCKKDPTVVDKTKCTYSGNPDHHYPLHRRGDRPPTQMPSMTAEFQNLAKENGYIYDDGHGDLLPVFYYVNK